MQLNVLCLCYIHCIIYKKCIFCLASLTRLVAGGRVQPQVGREDRCDGRAAAAGCRRDGLGPRAGHRGRAAAAHQAGRAGHNAAGLREGRRFQLPHGLHRGRVQPARRQLQDPAGRPPPLQTHRRQDHPGHRHHHVRGGRPGVPGAVQAGAGIRRARLLQERFRQSGAALLRLLRAHRGPHQRLLRQEVDPLGPVRGQGRDHPAAVPRLLQERAQARDHDAVARRLHAVLVLHAEGQVPGAAEPAHVRGGGEGVEEEAGAAREGAGIRAVLQ